MTRHLDSIYTPPVIAAQVAAAMPANVSGYVVDPAAGEGALLDAVVARFGDRAKPLAIDVDREAVAHLGRKDGWVVSRADSLNPKARRATQAWRTARRSLAAVVLNPPFSYRGNGGAVIRYGNFEGRVAPAVEFLAAALTDLNPKLGFWAILPEGALLADKHQDFWAEVREHYALNRIVDLPQSAFPGARVSATLIELRPGRSLQIELGVSSAPFEASTRTSCICVDVIRGRVPVHRSSFLLGRLPDGAAHFVHTTDTGIRPEQSKLRHAPEALADIAPMVLVTRVGRWNNPSSVDVGRVVLSDCLIAVRPLSRASLSSLLESIQSNSAAFSARYKGTGAKYLTLTNLIEALEELGWRPQVVKASMGASSCACGAESSSIEYGT